MDLNKLDEPFAAEDIEWRAQSCGKGNNGFWVSVLAYVTNRAIMARLDAVCGKANWKNEFRDVGKAVECGISIKIDGEWVTKWDAAEETNIEAVKGGRSGAMKRAAVQWGIGRYLYNLDAGWGQIVERGQHKAKTKHGEWFQWNPPQLPAWALPEQPKKPAQLKSQQPQFDGQDFLMRWTHIAQSCQALSALDQQKAKVLTPAWKQLNKQQQAAAKEVYDACKEDLETKGA